MNTLEENIIYLRKAGNTLEEIEEKTDTSGYIVRKILRNAGMQKKREDCTERNGKIYELHLTGLTNGEIAKKMNVKKGTVANTISTYKETDKQEPTFTRAQEAPKNERIKVMGKKYEDITNGCFGGWGYGSY